MHLPKPQRLALLLSSLALFAAHDTIAADAPASDALTFGGDLRVRNEYLNNDLTLNDSVTGHDQDYYRIRTRVWTAWKAEEFLVFNLRLAAEPRVWMESPTASKQHPSMGTEWRYGIVDCLNARWTGKFGDAWDVTSTLGRQDILLNGDPGKWWLVADGTPGEGSWTLFFDALRFTFENKPAGLKFDLVFLQSRALPDGTLPILGARKTYALTEQNERGILLYATKDVSPAFQATGYFIYKQDSRVLANGDSADIYTLGTRLVGSPAEHWHYDVEAAYQFGSKNDPSIKWATPFYGRRDLCAWGANGRVSYLFKDAMDNRVSLEFEYLSGDDPKTGKDEMFDVLWGRFPNWSDACIFAYATETGGRMGQMNNLLRIGPSWSLKPTKDFTLTAALAFLYAPESSPTRAAKPALFSFDGHDRGELWQLTAKYQFSKALSGLLVGELIHQGDFYEDNSTECFLRAEMMVKF